MSIQPTRRMITQGGLEVRADSDTVTVEGYASTFNQPYDMGWYSETVAQGAFTRTLSAKPDVRFMINHEGLPLARTTSNTLDLSQDSTGLNMRSTLDASDPDVQRIVPKMQRGDLNEMSFAFGVVEQEWSPDFSQRTLREVSLAGGDVSVVTYPANPNAGISLRMQQVLEQDPARLREIYRDLVEGRAGKTLSSDTSSKLTSLLESLATADDHIDGVLVDLSELLGVPNPDTDKQGMSDNQGMSDGSGDQQNSGRSAREIRNLIALARR
jgi:HK97 family phage prohead protease